MAAEQLVEIAVSTVAWSRSSLGILGRQVRNVLQRVTALLDPACDPERGGALDKQAGVGGRRLTSPSGISRSAACEPARCARRRVPDVSGRPASGRRRPPDRRSAPNTLCGGHATRRRRPRLERRGGPAVGARRRPAPADRRPRCARSDDGNRKRRGESVGRTRSLASSSSSAMSHPRLGNSGRLRGEIRLERLADRGGALQQGRGSHRERVDFGADRGATAVGTPVPGAFWPRRARAAASCSR